MARKWILTRQNYSSLGENTLAVEMASGGRDYANPGALVAKYPGEFDEYTNPVEMVNAAIAIARSWRKDQPQIARRIVLTLGGTGGNSIPLEHITFAEAEKWAKETYEKLPKCVQCGDILGKERFRPMSAAHDESEDCCSETCADRREEEHQQLNMEDAEQSAP